MAQVSKVWVEVLNILVGVKNFDGAKYFRVGSKHFKCKKYCWLQNYDGDAENYSGSKHFGVDTKKIWGRCRKFW